jgi:uncharacterized protein (TIGR00290 family)
MIRCGFFYGDIMKSFFSSWSGGKDSAIAFNEALKLGYTPKFILTMMNEEGEHSRSHSIPVEILKKHAELSGVDLYAGRSSWKSYESNYLDLATPHLNCVTHAVFGDIDIEDHKKWEEMICEKMGVEPLLPIFGKSREDVLDIYLNENYKAYIVTVDRKRLDRSFLGRELNRETIADIVKMGADSCGEFGEYHTIVTDAPFFSSTLDIKFGDIVDIGDYSYIEMGLAR